VANNVSGLNNLNTLRVTRQKSHSWKVTFPKFQNNEPNGMIFLSAILTQDELSHDVLEINFKGSVPSPDRIESGDPVKLDWEILGETASWVGYVHSINLNVKSSATMTRVVCVGNSQSMKRETQRTFTDVTADRVARKIAAEHGLKADTSRHPRVFPMISQTGQSDWQMLSRLATQCGFGFRVDNGVLTFKSRAELYQTSKGLSPYFKYIDEPNTAFIPFMTLYNFKPTLSENSPEIEGASLSRAVFGVDRNSNARLKSRKSSRYSPPAVGNTNSAKLLKQDQTPVFNKIITDEVVLSSSHSRHVITSKENHAAFRYTAKAESMGNPNVRPYRVIYLDGLPNEMSGYWVVTSVKHIFGSGKSYRMEMTVGSSQLGEPYRKDSTSLSTRDVSYELSQTTPPVSEEVTLDSSAYVSKVSSFIDPEVRAASIEYAKTVKYSTSMYEYMVPDFSEFPNVYRWKAKF